MDIISWYAVALGGLIVASILAYVFLSIVAAVQRYGKILFFRYLFYPQISKHLRRSGKTSWFDVLVLVMFLVANIIALSVGVRNVPGFIRRSGLISVVNLVPLFLGGQVNIVASRCGLGLRAYTRMHRWLGSVAILEGLLHAVVSVSNRTPNLKLNTDVYGLVAASIFLTILPSGLLRRRLYEAFLTIHFTLSLALLPALYLHTPTNIMASPTIYLLAATCLLVLIGCIRFGVVLYRNVRYRRPLNRASVRTITFKSSIGDDIPLPDAVHVHIRLSRGWKHRAGQYVYICMPGVSHTSFTQLHPFYVAWWYHNDGYDYAVFIMQRQRGFTDRVFSHRMSELNQEADFATVIEGPYGTELELDSYGTVLLFATGIGIAGQLPYVTQLLDGYHNYEVKTRRIALFWQVDSEIQTALVADQMQQLLKQDTGRILDIHIYVLGNFLSTVTHQGDHVQLGERIDMTYGPLHVKDVIENEMKQRKGRTVISTCADDHVSDAVRNFVQGMTNGTIYLKELDFRPVQTTVRPSNNPTAG